MVLFWQLFYMYTQEMYSSRRNLNFDILHAMVLNIFHPHPRVTHHIPPGANLTKLKFCLVCGFKVRYADYVGDG